jgi:hypothetical protein
LAGRNGAAVALALAATAMSSTLTLQVLPLSQSSATVLVPAVRVTGTVTVDQAFQLEVAGSVTCVVAPLTTRLSVRDSVLPSPPVELE